MSEYPKTSEQPDQADRGPEVAVASAPDPLLIGVVLLCVLITVASLRILARGDAEAPLPTTIAAVDPNSAPWWELTVLPEIGEHTARAIVQYRNLIEPPPSEDHRPPVFQTANDLAKVRGIGPKTVQRIAPYVHFEHYMTARN